MKKVLCLLLFAVLFIAGCTSSPPKESNTPDVTLRVVDGTVTPDGCTIILQNNTDLDYTYGYEYAVERKESEDWVTVETIIENYGFQMVAFGLRAGSEETIEENWAWLYGSLPSGEYRIYKRVSFGRGANYQDQKLYAEFTIPKKALTIEVVDGTLTPDGCTILMKNSTDKAYTHGNSRHFTVERFDGSTWIEVGTSGGTHEGHTINPDETKEIEYVWQSATGSLDVGFYRLAIDCHTGQRSTLQKYVVYAEFTIDN